MVLSGRLAHLERVTGTSLFVRGRDGVRLTSAGGALSPYARRLLAPAGETRLAVGVAAEPTVDRLDGWGRGVRVVRTIDETGESLLTDLGVTTVPPSVVARPLRDAPSTDLVAVWRPADEEREEVRALVRGIVRAGQRGLVSFPVEHARGAHK